MIHKERPTAIVVKRIDMDGRNTWYEIEYKCPLCGESIIGYAKENACDRCGTFYDWGDHEPRIEVIRKVKW